MSCGCGHHQLSPSSESLKFENGSKARLSLFVCNGCGRAGLDELRVGENLIARDAKARRLFHLAAAGHLKHLDYDPEAVARDAKASIYQPFKRYSGRNESGECLTTLQVIRAKSGSGDVLVACPDLAIMRVGDDLFALTTEVLEAAAAAKGLEGLSWSVTCCTPFSAGPDDPTGRPRAVIKRKPVAEPLDTTIPETSTPPAPTASEDVADVASESPEAVPPMFSADAPILTDDKQMALF